MFREIIFGPARIYIKRLDDGRFETKYLDRRKEGAELAYTSSYEAALSEGLKFMRKAVEL